MWDASYMMRPNNMNKDVYYELDMVLLHERVYNEIYINIKGMILHHTRVVGCKPTPHIQKWAVVGHGVVLVDD